VKIQISKTKSFEWTPPWERVNTTVDDVVGIELNSGNPQGCPAVRLQRHKDAIGVVAVGFVDEPRGALPSSWDELGRQPRLSISSRFRADCAALSINSPDAFTRQTAAEPFLAHLEESPEGVALSKDGSRSVFRRMADESSVLQASLPEYQVLWLNRLLPEGHRPTVVSVQTTASTLLACLARQPHFCEESDEAAIFVSASSITLAGFRKGMPLLFRECPGAAGVAAMREAVKTKLSLDDAMVETVFANNGIIDTRPALEPLLTPVVSQIELSLDYLKSRLGAEPRRLFLMGNAVGCNALRHAIGDRLSLPLESPNPFDGLVLPARASDWKGQYCVGETPALFLSALGAALAVMEGAK